jgi:hypothetical protein
MLDTYPMRKRQSLVSIVALLLTLLPSSAVAADGYWLDQYNALLFMGLMRLDPELSEMRRSGAKVVMVQSDTLPEPMLRWIAWRANRAGLKPVAWLQRPNPANLLRVGRLKNFHALQVDDHFFAKPPLAISRLKAELGTKELWCSFQPGQYGWRAARHCDHVDIQLYRQGCNATVDTTYRLGVAGRQDTAIATYHDGSAADDRHLSCMKEALRKTGNQLFVFKWKNPEHWLSPYTRLLWSTASRFLGRQHSKPT